MSPSIFGLVRCWHVLSIPRGHRDSGVPVSLASPQAALGGLRRWGSFDHRVVLRGPPGSVCRAIADRLGAAICEPTLSMDLPVRLSVRRRRSLAHGRVADDDRVLVWSHPPTLSTQASRPWHTSHSPAELLARREALRQRLGVHGQQVVALIGDGRDADAMRFMYACALASTAGMPVVALMPETGPLQLRATRFAGLSGQPARVLVVSGPIEDVLPAADVALWVGAGSGPMSPPPRESGRADHAVHRSWALGVPVVVPAWALHDAGELPPTIQSSLAFDATMPELVRVSLSLLEDADRRRALAQSSWAFASDEARQRRAVLDFEAAIQTLPPAHTLSWSFSE